jgi:hypothetical protein
MLPSLQIGRAALSSWYVAILISFFVFQPLRDIIANVTNFLVRVLNNILAIKIIDGNGLWIVLFFVCFIITFAIQRFFVAATGMQITKDGGKSIEIYALALLLIGLYLYVLNKIFIDQPMPTFFPDKIVYLLGGAENTFTLNSQQRSELVIWTVFQGFFFHLGPLFIFWISTTTDKS